MSGLLQLATVTALLVFSALTPASSQGFQLLSPRDRGRSIRGSYVDFGFYMTLSDCQDLARTKGGNAFNYLNQRCWVKDSDLSGDPRSQLSSAYGGWDVYVVTGTGGRDIARRGGPEATTEAGNRGGRRRGRTREGRRRYPREK